MLIWQDNEFDVREADARVEESGPISNDSREDVPLPVFLVGLTSFILLVSVIGEALAGSVIQ